MKKPGPGGPVKASARGSSSPSSPPSSNDTAPPSSDVEAWPDAIAAMQLARVSWRDLQRAARDGVVRKVFAAGQWRFDPEQLEALGSADPEDASLSRVTADVMGASVEGMRQGLEHSERGFKLYEQGAQRVLELLAAENARLAAENAKLHEAHADAIRAREEQLTQAHERQVAARYLEAKSKREERVVSMLSAAVPRLLKTGDVPQLGSGGDVASVDAAALSEARAEQLLQDPAVRRKVLATIELLSELEPTKMIALLGAGLLSAREEGLVRLIVDAPAPNGAHEGETTKGDNDHA